MKEQVKNKCELTTGKQILVLIRQTLFVHLVVRITAGVGGKGNQPTNKAVCPETATWVA